MVLQKVGSTVSRILVNGSEYLTNEQSNDTVYDVGVSASASNPTTTVQGRVGFIFVDTDYATKESASVRYLSGCDAESATITIYHYGGTSDSIELSKNGNRQSRTTDPHDGWSTTFTETNLSPSDSWSVGVSQYAGNTGIGRQIEWEIDLKLDASVSLDVDGVLKSKRGGE